MLRYLVQNDIKLGMRVQTGPDAGRLVSSPAIRSTLSVMLRRPIYAGCYVFGFSRGEPRRKKPGVPHSGRVRAEPMKWEVMIPDKLPAYITWDRFLANQKRLTANRCVSTAPGVPRCGQSLLTGLVYCGRCGRRMQVGYHANTAPSYYTCNTLSASCAGPHCQSFAGTSVDALVANEVLQALEPAKLELSFQAVADLECERQRLDQHWQKRLERAGIESQRAARQFNAVEPEDRMVARELEGRWEKALREQRGLEEEYDRFLADPPRKPTAEERQRIKEWSADLPGLWHASSTTIEDRKTIIRCLVERIIAAVRGQSEWLDVTIRWIGGLETQYEVCRPVRKYEQLSNFNALRDRAAELRRSGATAAAIAERLNHEGFRPPRGASRFHGHSIYQFLCRLGLSESGMTSWIKEGDLGRHEWRLRTWLESWECRSIRCGAGVIAVG